MTRNLAAAIGIGLCSFVAQPSHADWRVGLWGGANRARLHIDPVPLSAQLDDRGGTSFGATFEFPLSGAWSLSVEPGYVERGTGFRVDTDGAGPREPVRRDVRHSALEVPVLVKLSPLRGRVQPYLVAGVCLARLLKTSAGPLASSYFRPPYDYRLLDLAPSVGAGVQLGDGPLRVFAEGRYAWGVLNLAPPLEADPTRSRLRQVSAGLSWRIPGK